MANEFKQWVLALVIVFGALTCSAAIWAGWFGMLEKAIESGINKSKICRCGCCKLPREGDGK